MLFHSTFQKNVICWEKSFLAIYFNEVSDYDDYPSRYEGYGDKEEQGYGWAAPQSRRGGRTGGYYWLTRENWQIWQVMQWVKH